MRETIDDLVQEFAGDVYDTLCASALAQLQSELRDRLRASVEDAVQDLLVSTLSEASGGKGKGKRKKRTPFDPSADESVGRAAASPSSPRSTRAARKPRRSTRGAARASEKTATRALEEKTTAAAPPSPAPAKPKPVAPRSLVFDPRHGAKVVASDEVATERPETAARGETEAQNEPVREATTPGEGGQPWWRPAPSAAARMQAAAAVAPEPRVELDEAAGEEASADREAAPERGDDQPRVTTRLRPRPAPEAPNE